MPILYSLTSLSQHSATMMRTNASSMGGPTLEEHKGLGPAANLPTIQHTTAGPATLSLGSSTAQVGRLTGYKGGTKPNDYASRTDLLGVKDDSGREPNPSASDSEDEYNADPGALNISDRRKVQNSKFSAWCVVSKEVTATSINAHRIKLG